MPGDASAADVPATLAGRVRSAPDSGDLDAIAELLDPAARWGAPEGPSDVDCRNRGEVVAWWARARAAGARARVTEVTVGAETLLVGLVHVAARNVRIRLPLPGPHGRDELRRVF